MSQSTADAKTRKPLICLVGTRIPIVSLIELQFILLLKILIRNKASRCRRLDYNNNNNNNESKLIPAIEHHTLRCIETV
jgi:hypothetical protein